MIITHLMVRVFGDYIHVDDLARAAHLFALEYLSSHHSTIFNVGYGRGFSVKEVLETMQHVSQCDFKTESALSVVMATLQYSLLIIEKFWKLLKRCMEAPFLYFIMII